jgi:hypothetical protein
VFSVLSNVLDDSDISAHEFNENRERPKDEYIDHDRLRQWFASRLMVSCPNFARDYLV